MALKQKGKTKKGSCGMSAFSKIALFSYINSSNFLNMHFQTGISLYKGLQVYAKKFQDAMTTIYMKHLEYK